jgi:C-terminal processing protease CtpA/Prc
MRRLVAACALVALAAAPVWPQTPDQVERLATLGKVWGFLKYYHPAVATGTVNWDLAVVTAVPTVKAARTPSEFQSAIQSLIDAAGVVPRCGTASCSSTPPDSVMAGLDQRWLRDEKLLGAEVARRLENIRVNRHVGKSRYIAYTITAMFDADTAYNSPEYPEEGVRLLALYRFWNAARYFFPYMNVNDGNWNAVLPEFIPRLINAKDAEQYHLTLLELTTRLHDAHVGGGSPQLVKTLGGRFVWFEAKSVDGKIAVWKLLPSAPPDAGGLKIGDVITHIDGVPVEQRRRNLAKYIAAGNPAVFERKLIAAVLRESADSVTYTIERDGKVINQRVAMATPPTAPTPNSTFPVTTLARMLPNSSIGYINMGDINSDQVDSAIAIVKNATGIVMDVRNYPRGTMYQFANFFNPEARPFVKFTAVDSTYPGAVRWRTSLQAGQTGGNRDYYRGRIAILVDERTQSHAEFSVMALRTSPENRVIGSQTAGADGNITRLTLPGGFRTLFTGLGVFYPNGKETQRVGIVPDVEVRPTLNGFRAGRDEVLERAIEYLTTGR